MQTLQRVVGGVSLLFVLVAPSITAAESLATPTPAALLRPEWTVERMRTGRAHVVGYLYNDNGVRNAANVLLRVEEVTAGGAVGKVYQSRIVGDVLSRGRMSFDVPVAGAEGDATYRVLVESVDWVMECR
jgi:hypothetical protein